MFSASTRVFPFRSLLRLSPCRPAPSPTMTSAYAQLSQNGLTKGPAQSSYTITGLSRWSVINKQLPPVDQIKSLHIYDFDNTREWTEPPRSFRPPSNALSSEQSSKHLFRMPPSGPALRSVASAVKMSLSMEAGGTTLGFSLRRARVLMRRRSEPGMAGGMRRSST